MRYLQGKGYRVIPVNPGIAGRRLLGEPVYASLRDIPDKVDMVDMFRAAEEASGVVADAIAIWAEVVWMQLGVRNDEAAASPSAAGIEVIMNPRRPPEGRLGVLRRAARRAHIARWRKGICRRGGLPTSSQGHCGAVTPQGGGAVPWIGV